MESKEIIMYKNGSHFEIATAPVYTVDVDDLIDVDGQIFRALAIENNGGFHNGLIDMIRMMFPDAHEINACYNLYWNRKSEEEDADNETV